ncbi:MAG: flagellar protein FlgN [bacterium]
MSRFESHETEDSGELVQGRAMTAAPAIAAMATTAASTDESCATARLLRLAAILDEQGTLYEEMAGVSLSVRESLVRFGIDSLRDKVRKQESIIERIDLLERERAAVVDALTQQLGGGPHPMSVGEIVAAASDPECEKLRGVRERVLAEVHRMQRISQTNAYLISNSLELVEAELALFADRDEVAYDRDGENVAGDAKTRILDRRA